MTLRELIAEHPEWLDLPIAVSAPDGELDFVGASGSVYITDVLTAKSDDDPTPMLQDVLVFAGN